MNLIPVIPKEGESMKDAMARTKKEVASKNIENTLADRGSKYGPFEGHASITQDIKRAMRGESGHGAAYGSNWNKLPDNMKEALEMVAHKIGRILNGDPEYKDSWVDIEGYVHLVSVTLKD